MGTSGGRTSNRTWPTIPRKQVKAPRSRSTGSPCSSNRLPAASRSRTTKSTSVVARTYPCAPTARPPISTQSSGRVPWPLGSPRLPGCSTSWPPVRRAPHSLLELEGEGAHLGHALQSGSHPSRLGHGMERHRKSEQVSHRRPLSLRHRDPPGRELVVLPRSAAAASTRNHGPASDVALADEGPERAIYGARARMEGSPGACAQKADEVTPVPGTFGQGVENAGACRESRFHETILA